MRGNPLKILDLILSLPDGPIKSIFGRRARGFPCLPELDIDVAAKLQNLKLPEIHVLK
jgi:hypothetical protein